MPHPMSLFFSQKMLHLPVHSCSGREYVHVLHNSSAHDSRVTPNAAAVCSSSSGLRRIRVGSQDKLSTAGPCPCGRQAPCYFTGDAGGKRDSSLWATVHSHRFLATFLSFFDFGKEFQDTEKNLMRKNLKRKF